MATNGVYANYQEIIDLHTEQDRCTALGIHTPTGDFPKQMFSGFFEQFKKYKYLGCSVSLVPSARLPADPLQVRSEPGQVFGTYLDPRDTLNPIMFHGCHGEDMGTILNQMIGEDSGISDSVIGLESSFGDDALMGDLMERLYYKALTDSTWKKAHPQRGFRKSGLRPLVYSVATNRPFYPGSVATGAWEDGTVAEDANGNLKAFVGQPGDIDFGEISGGMTSASIPVFKDRTQFFTPRLMGLGWLDTRQPMTLPVTEEYVANGNVQDTVKAQFEALVKLQSEAVNEVRLPKLFMGIVLLPPAYGVEQYYRMIINHRFAFKGFRGISFRPEISGVPTYFDANSDLFKDEPEFPSVDPQVGV